MAVMIRTDNVRNFVDHWLDEGTYPDVEITDEERAVALAALGYDTPAHCELTGVDPAHLAPARRIAAQMTTEGLI